MDFKLALENFGMAFLHYYFITFKGEDIFFEKNEKSRNRTR